MDLEQLIATEQRLDEALRAARDEAARLVAEAKAALHRQEVVLETEIEVAARSFAAETAAERERREREVRSEAAQAAARYEAVSLERVAAAARDVVQRLVAGEAAP